MRAIKAAMTLLSIPPDRNMPRGTSLISRSRTDSSSLARNSANELATGRRLGPVLSRDWNVPVPTYRRDAVLVDEEEPRHQPADSTEERLIRRQVARRQELRERRLVGASLDESALEDRLDLRSEEEPAADDRPVKGLDAQAIAREQKPPLRRVPDREREHAAEAMHAVVSPLLVGVNDGLGVGASAIDVAGRLEPGAQVRVVVDLAIEGDPDGAGFVRQRLLSAGQVDNAESAVTEGGVIVDVNACLIRPAVGQDVPHG